MRCSGGSLATFATFRLHGGRSRTLRIGVIDPMRSLEKWGAAVFASELGEADAVVVDAFASAGAMSADDVTQIFSKHG